MLTSPIWGEWVPKMSYSKNIEQGHFTSIFVYVYQN